jgi:hypothetical protein
MYAADKSGNDAMYPKDLKKRADVSRAYHYRDVGGFANLIP